MDERERSALSNQRPNRATRRAKPKKYRYNIIDYTVVPENILTKPSHKYKKLRSQNAIETRKERAFRTRKANQENTEEVS